MRKTVFLVVAVLAMVLWSSSAYAQKMADYRLSGRRINLKTFHLSGNRIDLHQVLSGARIDIGVQLSGRRVNLKGVLSGHRVDIGQRISGERVHVGTTFMEGISGQFPDPEDRSPHR